MYFRGDGYAGLFLAAFFTVMKTGFEVFFFCAFRPVLRLSRRRIVHRNHRLEQEDETGSVITSIDLERAWSLSFDYNTLGHALYTLDQEGRTLTFTSRLNGAQRLVADMLGRPDLWPPRPVQPESAATRYHRRAETNTPPRSPGAS